MVATLVRRPTHGETNCAVLHLHGFADYFFQTEYAEWWTERGYTFYALDLRKYGRSIRGAPDPQLRQRPERVLPGDRRGLPPDHRAGRARGRRRLRPLHRRPHAPPLGLATGTAALAGMVLNSPWFDLQGAVVAAHRRHRARATRRRPRAPGRRAPHRERPLRPLASPGPRRATGPSTWPGSRSSPGRCAPAGCARSAPGTPPLHRGLEVGCPALVLSSARTGRPVTMDEDVHTTDIVLDVEQIRRWAPSLGRARDQRRGARCAGTTWCSPAPQPRAEVYRALDAWLAAWVEAAPETGPEAATQDGPVGQPARNAASATSPTTTIVARSQRVRQPSTHLGSELTADHGADGDQQHHLPVDRRRRRRRPVRRRR